MMIVENASAVLTWAPNQQERGATHPSALAPNQCTMDLTQSSVMECMEIFVFMMDIFSCKKDISGLD